MDKVTDCIVREEMSRVCQSISAAWSAATHISIWPIWAAARPTRRSAGSRGAARRDDRRLFALSEPDGGSDTRALKTKAEKVEGGWRLNGAKLYITNAPSRISLPLAARTRPELTTDAISLFMVDLPNPGVEIFKLDKEGIRASETGLVHLADAFVPDEALLGGKEGSYHLVMEALAETASASRPIVWAWRAMPTKSRSITRRRAWCAASRSSNIRPSPIVSPTWRRMSRP